MARSIGAGTDAVHGEGENPRIQGSGHPQVFSLNPGRDLWEWTPEGKEGEDFGGFHWTLQLPHRHEVQGREGLVASTEAQLLHHQAPEGWY